MNYIFSGVNNQVMLHCIFSFWGEQPSRVHERLPLSSPWRNRIQLDMSKTEVITVICFSGVEKLKHHHATGYMQTSSYWYNNVLCFRSRHTKSFAWTQPPHSTATKHHSAIQVNTDWCPETWPCTGLISELMHSGQKSHTMHVTDLRTLHSQGLPLQTSMRPLLGKLARLRDLHQSGVASLQYAPTLGYRAYIHRTNGSTTSG